MKRLVFVFITAVLPAARLGAYESASVTFDYVADKAQERALKPFRSPAIDLPDFLREDKLDYDKWRQIQFRDEEALWAAEPLPFRIEFFHPGYIYSNAVHAYEFTPTHVQTIRFVQDWFDYGSLKLPRQVPPGTGYAGFKVLYPVNSSNKWDEIGAFLGDSYFRLLGAGQEYGMASRGLAIDSGEPDRLEEFPIFTDWWLSKPTRGEDRLKLFAILDSVSCVGAYQFIIVPGKVTVADVDARLFFREDDKIHRADPERKPIKTIGMAPLTSMFWYGKASERRFDDYREEVHDSDGLLMQMGNGETLWRALNNPAKTGHQVFAARDIVGFGLMQRNRGFWNYQDLFRRYDRTPSVWVRPNGKWGQGEIHLVEISTQDEWNDNIVAFWNPKEQPPPLKPMSFSYTLKWGLTESEMGLDFGKDKVVSTRIGADARDPKVRQFAIDFAGPKLKQFTPENPPQAITSCSANAGISDSQIFPLPDGGGWRVIVKLEPHDQNPVDIRCTLQKGEEVISETWTYHWSPL